MWEQRHNDAEMKGQAIQSLYAPPSSGPSRFLCLSSLASLLFNQLDGEHPEADLRIIGTRSRIVERLSLLFPRPGDKTQERLGVIRKEGAD